MEDNEETIEPVFDSTRYTNEIINANKSKEEEEKEVENLVFRCEICGYRVDPKNPPVDPFNSKKKLNIDDYRYQSDPSKVKCPNCGKKVNYKVITEEENIKLEEEKQKKIEEKKQIKEKRDKKRRTELLKEDLKELINDLKDRLFTGDITSKRFVAIFSHISVKLFNRYNKKRDLEMDSVDFGKAIYNLSDEILKVYKERQKSEEILAEYDESIEDDELYKAELEYYIEDNEFAIPDYELRKRIREYEKLEKDIKGKEYKKEIEEKYQERKNTLMERAQQRKERQKLREIM